MVIFTRNLAKNTWNLKKKTRNLIEKLTRKLKKKHSEFCTREYRNPPFYVPSTKPKKPLKKRVFYAIF
jgi:hypothetical protein